MADIYNKNIINSIYGKLNENSKSRCKTRFPNDKNNFSLCFYQAMIDNAKMLITKLKGQLGNCMKTNNPNKCKESINNLIEYLNKKQEEYETNINQLKNLGV